MSWSALVDALPSVVALIGAALAALAARSARQAETKAEVLRGQAQRLRDLEARNAEKKHDTYEPMIDLLSQMLDKENAKRLTADNKVLRDRMTRFDAWVAIYGSDDAVRAWHNFRQGAFHSAPPMIFMRLYSDFVVAARMDMGSPNSDLSPEELLGIRITDIYTNDQNDLRAALTLKWTEIEGRFGWEVPWLRRHEKGNQSVPNEP